LFVATFHPERTFVKIRTVTFAFLTPLQHVHLSSLHAAMSRRTAAKRTQSDTRGRTAAKSAKHGKRKPTETTRLAELQVALDAACKRHRVAVEVSDPDHLTLLVEGTPAAESSFPGSSSGNVMLEC